MWHDPWLDHYPLIWKLGSAIFIIMESTNLVAICKCRDCEGWKLTPTNHVLATEFETYAPQLSISGYTCNLIDLFNRNMSSFRVYGIQFVIKKFHRLG